MESIWTFLINDLWSVHLTIMGILVSVITLLYATLSSRVEELKSIKKSEEYVLMNRSTALHNSIKTLRSLNRKVTCGLASTFTLFVITSVLKYLPEANYTNWLVLIDTILTIGLLVYGVILAHGVYIQYQKETN